MCTACSWRLSPRWCVPWSRSPGNTGPAGDDGLSLLALCFVSTGLWTSAVHLCRTRAPRAHWRADRLVGSHAPHCGVTGRLGGTWLPGRPGFFSWRALHARGQYGAPWSPLRSWSTAGAALLFADSNSTATAVQHATTQLPIVFAAVEDPVGSGLVQSFAQPGGNITGVASLDIELGPKRLQLFHELVPGLTRVLFLYEATDVYSQEAANVYREAARRLGLELVGQVVRTTEEVANRAVAGPTA